GELLVEAEEIVMPFLGAFVAPIVSGMFGTSENADAFKARDNRDARGQGAREIVEAYFEALAGAGGATGEPGTDGAKDVATAAVHAALEGWFNAIITETISDLAPFD